MVDIMPLQEFSYARPFTGLIININVATVAHKDNGDSGGCIVISLGPFTGGQLCLYQPHLAVETRSGDAVAFNSKRYVHFNLHYKGTRCSLVFQSDQSALSHLKDMNSWKSNAWVR